MRHIARIVDTMSLNARQIRFVNEYLIDFNGTKAAIRAGYSENCAGQTAYDLLILPQIHQMIESKKAEYAAAAELSAEWVLRQWKEIADTAPNENIKTRDRLQALELIAKYLGMLVEKKEISGPGGSPIAMSNIRATDLTDDQLAAIIAGDDIDDESNKG
jgi:hypothetical protein